MVSGATFVSDVGALGCGRKCDCGENKGDGALEEHGSRVSGVE